MPPPSKARLVWFDLTAGLPVALRVLREELPAAMRRQALLHFLRRSATADPFRDLPPAASAGEAFSRHQLRPVVLFSDVLRDDLGLNGERTLDVLRRLVAETGSRFIASQVALPERSSWDRMSEQSRQQLGETMLARFGNAEAHVVDSEGYPFAFDVSFCHFAHLTRQIGHPELAPLFCAADSVFFSRPAAPVRLERNSTLADGGVACTFRFRWP